MIFKFNLVFLVLTSVSLSFGQNRKPKGPRDYTEEYPESRRLPIPPTPSFPNVDTLDVEILPNKQNHTLKPSKLSEHPECAKCLNNRYLKHYYAKGCKPVEGEVICKKMCPKYFDCPKKSISSTTGCEYKGRIYNTNEKVPVDNPCKECVCKLDTLSKPTIICADFECFADFSLPPKNCYNVYELNKCCSSGRKCPTDDELENINKCTYRGRHYKLGERIFPEEDPCLECICNEDWNQRRLEINLNSTSCRKISCEFELNANSKAGCIPVYSEKSCCPIEYHCPPPKEHHCLFDGQKYRIGEKLDFWDNITQCTCRIPPEFTCIKIQTFMRLRNTLTKSENLQTVGSEQPINITVKEYRNRPLVVKYPTHEEPINITVNNGWSGPSLEEYPSKLKTNRSQTIRPSDLLRPSKPINNTEFLRPVILTTAKPRTKPRKCPPFIPEGLSCPGFNCTTIIDSNGCQACSCEKSCPELNECNDPCYMFAVTPGECPRCKCP